MQTINGTLFLSFKEKVVLLHLSRNKKSTKFIYKDPSSNDGILWLASSILVCWSMDNFFEYTLESWEMILDF
jgi:hypothetical protein